MSFKQFTIADTSPAAASTAAGSTLGGLASYDAFSIVAELVGATGGTLDVYLQTSPDNGTTWYDQVHFPQLASGASAVKYMVNMSRTTSGGITAVGKNTTPALAANTVVQGLVANKMRALYVAGASTSVGAAVAISVLAFNQRV